MYALVHALEKATVLLDLRATPFPNFVSKVNEGNTGKSIHPESHCRTAMDKPKNFVFKSKIKKSNHERIYAYLFLLR